MPNRNYDENPFFKNQFRRNFSSWQTFELRVRISGVTMTEERVRAPRNTKHTKTRL